MVPTSLEGTELSSFKDESHCQANLYFIFPRSYLPAEETLIWNPTLWFSLKRLLTSNAA